MDWSLIITIVTVIAGACVYVAGLAWHASKISTISKQVNGLPTKHAVLEESHKNLEKRVSQIEIHILKDDSLHRR